MNDKGPFSRSYSISVDPKWIKNEWSAEEKELFRPIAETLAMLDGNAFLSHKLPDGRDWYEQYLSEAATIFEENGGLTGHAGTASWVTNQTHENKSVEYAYKNWQYGEVVDGPKMGRHWITVTLMYPNKLMPDPNGANRLVNYDCKVNYRKAVYVTPVKIKTQDDLEIGRAHV